MDDQGGRGIDIAEVLAHRLRSFAAFRDMLQAFPGGLVPVATAARMLGVSRQRLSTLIAQGRVPVLALPTGSDADQLVPVDCLIGMPTPLDSGRGRDHHKPETPERINGRPRNPWAEGLKTAVRQSESALESGADPNDAKKSERFSVPNY